MPHLSSNHPDPDIRQRSNELLKAAGYTADDFGDSNPSDENALDASTSGFLGAVSVVLALIGIVWVVLSVLDAIEAREKVIFDQRAAQVGDLIPGLIGNLKVRQESFDSKGLSPALIWQGKDATILTTQVSDMPIGIFRLSNKFVGKSWTTIAQTKSGRYFTVTHSFRLDCSSTNSNADWEKECVSRTEFIGLTIDQVKRKIFESGDSVLFEKTFGEKMPPVEIKA